MKRNRIIYSVVVEDVYTVAEEVFGRPPTEEELKFVEEKIAERIAWHYTIESLLIESQYEMIPK